MNDAACSQKIMEWKTSQALGVFLSRLDWTQANEKRSFADEYDARAR